MEFRSDLAPPSDGPAPEAQPSGEATPGQSKFSQMLAEVEKHRTRVTAGIAVGLVARLLVEFNFIKLAQNPANLIGQIPWIGMAMLSYLIVLMWLAMKTRDRFGFGMALGVGVLEATYMIVMGAMQSPFDIKTLWPPVVAALAHIPMAVFAFRASTSYPPHDSKRPWLVGFITALVFLAVPWIAPAVLGAIN
jgi:hypothetical protein